MTNNNEITFKHLTYEWLELKKLSVKQTTYAKYSNIIDVHLSDLLEQSELLSWSITDYKSLLKELSEKGLAAATVKTIIYVLKSIINHGERNYNIEHINLSCLKIETYKHEIHVLNDNERIRLAEFCQSGYRPVQIAVYISMYSGMRIGEICGLKWENINFDNKTIEVLRTVQRLKSDSDSNSKTKLLIFPPKTVSSKRIVVMTDFLAEYLYNYKNSCDPVSSEHFILTNSITIPEPRNIQRNFKKVCNILDIDINFHILRHTFATNCIKYDMDLKVLSELLGHANITTTMNLYVHPTLEFKSQQINKIPK